MLNISGAQPLHLCGLRILLLFNICMTEHSRIGQIYELLSQKATF